jgi:ssDNA-binding Zn-finger/Zn-ribbon topoisomerase 1
MSKFRLRSEIIDASRWFKNGDHPLDNIKGHRVGDEGEFVGYSKGKEGFLAKKCDKCGAVMRVHGEINRLGEVGYSGLWWVCPGSWVLTPPDDTIEIMSHVEFSEMYEEVDDRGAPLIPENIQRFVSVTESPQNPYTDAPKPEQQCPTCRFDIEELDVCMKDRRRIQRNEAGKLFKAVNCPFWEFGKELPKVEVTLAPEKPKPIRHTRKRGHPKKFISPDEIYPRETI